MKWISSFSRWTSIFRLQKLERHGLRRICLAQKRYLIILPFSIMSLMLLYVVRSDNNATWDYTLDTIDPNRFKLERSFRHVLVEDCINRIPRIPGKTYDSVVKGVGVSFISWSSGSTIAVPKAYLRTYGSVRIMNMFEQPATLLDIGANIGKVSFPVLAMSQKHTVISVEPVKKNVDSLCMTANLNGWIGHPRFILMQAAMSHKNGKMRIYVPDGREDNSALHADAASANVHISSHGEDVSIVKGDDVLSRGGLTPDVIKIDTQGHELFVLKGLRGYLKRAKKTIVIAESDPMLMKKSGVDPRDVYDLMVAQLRYTPFVSANVTVIDGQPQVSGNILSVEGFTRGKKDILFFKT